MNTIYLDGVEINKDLFPKHEIGELREFSNLCIRYLCFAERERFFNILAHFNGDNQAWLISPMIDLMCKSRYNFTWMVYDDEPKEYVSMSEEIRDLFEGLLWRSEPQELHTGDVYRIKLIAIDNDENGDRLPF